jgi:nucleotide-binding universal stress UspA family protein
MQGSIVVGTDGSSTARAAVDRACRLAEALGAAVHLVSAYRTVPTTGMPAEMHAVGHARQAAEEVLEEAAREIRVPLETYAVPGDAAEALISVAETHGARMIVVGSRGMSSARRFVLGNVPNKVSHHAPCSVLIVRTH